MSASLRRGIGALGVVALLACVLALPVRAEDRGRDHFWEITPLVGIGWGGSIDFVGSTSGGSGEIEFESGPVIGAQIGARFAEEGAGFVSYQFQRTTAEVRWDANFLPDQSIDVDIGYLQFGGELELPVNPRLTPFIGLGIGATHITPREGDGDTEWFFSGSFFGGAKLALTRHVGLRLQMNLLATVIQNDSDIFCVSSGGLTCAVSTDLESMIQGNFVGSVYVAF